MALNKITDNLNIIQALDDEPNDVGGLTAQELKAKFDEAGNTIKTRVNALVDQLGSANAAADIGFNATAGVDENNVQDAIENVQAQLVAVTQGAVTDGSITTAKLAAKAVTTAKIDDLAVTDEKLAAASVTSDKLGNGVVVSNKIAPSAVTTGKINDGAVTENKIGSAAVSTDKIKNDAVTSDKIADNAVQGEHVAKNTLRTDVSSDYAMSTVEYNNASTATLTLKMHYIRAIGIMFFEGYVKFKPVSAGTATFVYEFDHYAPDLDNGGTAFGTEVNSGASFGHDNNDNPILNISKTNIASASVGNNVYAFVSGWYFCEGA